MQKLKAFIKKTWLFLQLQSYRLGKQMLTDQIYKADIKAGDTEYQKLPSRTEVINTIVSKLTTPVTYLEIGVRNPEDNYNHIRADQKYSVDPGLEFEENSVDFQMTSDEFFKQLRAGDVLSKDQEFDVIFIDGLHLAEQVERDIENAFSFLSENGIIVMHDCNPPTEWHTRSNYQYMHTPARGAWNGTTWKAFYKWRCKAGIQSCCVDTDYGIGLLSKHWSLGDPNKEIENSFFEYENLIEHRKEHLNLVSFETLKTIL